MADGSDYISGIPNERHRISRSRAGAFLCVRPESFRAASFSCYTYPLGMTIFLFSSLNGYLWGPSRLRRTAVDGLCVDSHEINDLGIGNLLARRGEPSSVFITLALLYESMGKCTVFSLRHHSQHAFFPLCASSMSCRGFS